MQRNSKQRLVSSAPAFKRLVATRNRWRFALTAMTLLCHAFFVGGITVYRDLFSAPLMQGGTITLGIVFTVLVLLLFIVFQFVYIVVSEKKLDRMQDDALEEFEANG